MYSAGFKKYLVYALKLWRQKIKKGKSNTNEKLLDKNADSLIIWRWSHFV